MRVSVKCPICVPGLHALKLLEQAGASLQRCANCNWLRYKSQMITQVTLGYVFESN